MPERCVAPDLFRSGSLLPYHGVMTFDSADLGSMASDGTLLSVILHEAHASVAGMHDAGRQPFHEHGQQVGAVHAVELDLARQFRGSHRRRVGAVRRREAPQQHHDQHDERGRPQHVEPRAEPVAMDEVADPVEGPRERVDEPAPVGPIVLYP